MHLHKSGLLAPRANIFLLTITLMLVSIHGIESIVKPQSQSQAQQSQQQRSDDVPLQQQQNSNNQNAFNNHQTASASAQPGGASSASSQQVGGQQSASAAQPGSRGSSPSMDSINSYTPPATSANQKPASSYMDGMAAAVSNPEQSYQAAAQSVNIALANSGIFGPNSYAPQQSQQPQQQQQGAVNSQQGPQSSLNPLHYFYYPAKDNSQNVAPNSAPSSANKQQDMMANSASNNYQSMASYPSYGDQYNSYASDAAASSQDPSYLPQPLDQQAQSSQVYSQGGQQSQGSQQLMNGANSQPQQYGNSDLGAYNSNQSPSSSISFNGPSSNGPQQPQQNPLPQVGQNNDYLNSHIGGHQPQQSGAASQPQNSYQNNLFNQLASGGDLSTSNFGNNAGSLSTIASYMPPNSQPSNGQQQPSQPHDLFSNGLLGSPFNSAASQLSTAAIAPPNQQQAQQQSQQQTNSLYSGSLFGSKDQQLQAQQQQSNLFGSGVNGAHNYLNSFLTPQQYQQLTGQQLTAMASEQSPFTTNSLQQQQPTINNQASSANPIAAASGHSKRFGLSSFIMPMLALAGLSLLIPTVSNLSPIVGRKKRSIVEEKESASNRQQQIQHNSMNGAHQILKENSIGDYLERIERYYSIYRNAVENDDCLNKLICEFGDAVKGLTGKSAVMSVLETVVPDWMSGKMHVFKEAAFSTSSYGKEKCKKYVCHNSRQHK